MEEVEGPNGGGRAGESGGREGLEEGMGRGNGSVLSMFPPNHSSRSPASGA